MAKAKDFFEFAKKNNAEMMDLKFVDMLGSWQHCSFPMDVIDDNTFQEGLGFDGSSIRGWQGIHMSDMMAIPDPNTFCLDPFFAKPTVSIIADIIRSGKKGKLYAGSTLCRSKGGKISEANENRRYLLYRA